ncbi:hypothetical protein [Novosphingobium sp. 9]|uniref:hypothetical protein n=1 Tax=Novosphingobium sp. 9 TaxID=2025349 RepID=UPI0021B5496F|nr:hypothetical protein [Novosphingobium sp. 9]
MTVRLAALAAASFLALAAPVAHARTAQVSLAHACVEGSGDAEAAAHLLAQRLTERGLTGQGGCRLTIRLDATSGLGEGYRIRREGHGFMVSASQRRGYVYAAGWLLSHLHGAMLDWNEPVDEHPALAVRGDQIGIRAKNNSFDAWTPAMLARHVDDLALMGANRIQLVGPVSDDAGASPLAPVPAMDAILATAREAKALGLEVALYQPLLRDYAKPGADAAELATFTDLIDRFPALDAVYFPGGDPGNTHPDILFPLLAKLAVPLRARFPKAELLVSTQGFDEAGFLAFVAQIRKRPSWLSAVFVGPQTRGSIARHRELIDPYYPLELYPTPRTPCTRNCRSSAGRQCSR